MIHFYILASLRLNSGLVNLKYQVEEY